MAEMTNIGKFRQRKNHGLRNKLKQESSSANSYFYPQSNLYSKEEFELLDTIYSDEAAKQEHANRKVSTEQAPVEDFWPRNREEYLTVTAPKSSFLTNLMWFCSGVLLTSAVWLVYFQISVKEIKTRADTQIVFQKATAIMTDKTVDKEVSKQLNQKPAAKGEVKKAKGILPSFLANWFQPKEAKLEAETQSTPEQAQEVKEPTTPPVETQLRYHTVANGDSLWTIAQKYYESASPSNMNKIMKANNLRRASYLRPGQRLIIPN